MKTEYKDRMLHLAKTRRCIFTSEFLFSAWTLERDMEFLRYYWNQTEVFLIGSARKWQEKGNELDEYNPELYDFWHLERAINQHMIDETESYIHLLRGSFIVALYSNFESRFADYARLIAGDGSLIFNGIDEIKQYIKAIHGVRFAFGNSKLWRELMNIREIRNCIVHNQANISGLSERRKQKLISYISTRSALLSTQKQTLRIQEDYIYIVLEVIDEFCWSFLVSISDRFVERFFE